VRPKLSQTLVIVTVLLWAALGTSAAVTLNEAAKALPNSIDSFRARGPAQTATVGIFEQALPDEFGAISHAVRGYSNDTAADLVIDLVTTRSDSGAYALLTRLRLETEELKSGVVGTASIISPNRVVFCKGVNLVRVSSEPDSALTQDQLLNVAKSFAAGLPAGDDDLPVLVKHLPNWQAMKPRASYAVSLENLKTIVPNQQALLDTISFDGSTEAVAANYGSSQLVIVEFTTPQLAGENDRRIAPKIEELRSLGQTLPSAYRRVGNYSVFVFNAPDEQTANQLIGQVKYEQVVQWLGDNPHWYEKAVREWAQTSADVVLTVLKSSGLSLLVCLGLGGAIGALLFRRRRAFQSEAAIYSDAGGMVRLDLDEITQADDAGRLLTDGRGKR
jgi:uncharacterized protein DUF6599